MKSTIFDVFSSLYPHIYGLHKKNVENTFYVKINFNGGVLSKKKQKKMSEKKNMH